MDPITRDILIRLRWEKSPNNSPLDEEERRLRKQMKEDLLARRQAAQAAREAQEALRAKQRAEKAAAAAAKANALAQKRQEQETHKRRLKEVAELKRKIREGRDLVRDFGEAGKTAAKWLGVGAVTTGGVLTKGFVDAALEADKARLSIATMVQSADGAVGGPFKGVQDSLVLTTDLLKQMRQAALDTPAGFEDIQRAFQDVAVPARMAGSSYKDIIDLASSMSTTNKVLGFEEGVVSRDVQQLLRGDIGDISTPMLRANRMAIQQLFKDNKHSEMLEKIRESLTIAPEMKKLFEESPEGRISQVKDEWQLFKADAGQPILGWLSDELKAGLEYLQKNREEVKKLAGDIGTGIVEALKQIKQTLAWMWENREDIIGWAKWLGGAAGLAVVVTTLGSIVGVLKTIIGLGPALAGAMAPLAGGALNAVKGAAGNMIVKSALGGAAGVAGVASTAGLLGVAGLAAWGVGEAISPAFEAILARSEDEIRRDKAEIDVGKAQWQVPQFLEAETYANSADAFRDALKGDKAFNQMNTDLRWQRVNSHIMKGMGHDTSESLAWLESIHDTLKNTQALAANYTQALDLSQGYMSGLIKGGWNPLKDTAVKPTPDQGVHSDKPNMDARGARITIHQRVETNNPAALARASLVAGFEAVVRRPIRPNQPAGSVRLANGDRG